VLRESAQRWEDGLDTVLGELELRQDELAQFEIELADERRQLTADLDSLAEEKLLEESRESILEEQITELETAHRKETEHREQEEESHRTECDELNGRIEELEAALEKSRSRDDRRAEDNEKLGELQEELSRARTEIAESEEKLLDQEIEQEDTLAASRRNQEENDAISAELERVRQRSVEQSEKISELKHELTTQREEAASDLSETKRRLEIESKSGASHDASAATAGGDSRTSSAKSADDHVVGSVMAQFKKLKSQRGKQKGKKPTKNGKWRIVDRNEGSST